MGSPRQPKELVRRPPAGSSDGMGPPGTALRGGLDEKETTRPVSATFERTAKRGAPAATPWGPIVITARAGAASPPASACLFARAVGLLVTALLWMRLAPPLAETPREGCAREGPDSSAADGAAAMAA